VLDEATSMLDPQGQREVMATGRRLNQEGVTVIYITHSMEEAAEARRVIVMAEGSIVMDGPPVTVFARARELRRVHLDVPEAVRFAGTLRGAGVELPPDILTVDQLEESLAGLAGAAAGTRARSGGADGGGGPA
ncbi:MAG: energy-coupling factor transporter ATPase, partial [Armatimonadetes bacterium]|nr:energy-coupling factor transporter ATPase [Armatimonadota bacterium]